MSADPFLLQGTQGLVTRAIKMSDVRKLTEDETDYLIQMATGSRVLPLLWSAAGVYVNIGLPTAAWVIEALAEYRMRGFV